MNDRSARRPEAIPTDTRARVDDLHLRARHLKGSHLRALLTDRVRLNALQVDAGPVHLDLSRQRIDASTLETLWAWAAACDFDGARKRLAEGHTVNFTEGRAAVHPALRGRFGPVAVRESARFEHQRMAALVGRLRSGELLGFDGSPLKALVCLGIGGSDLGPRLITDALAPDGHYPVRFAANADPRELDRALHGLAPQSTAIAILSKTFTTRETLANAAAARAWLREAGCPPEAEFRHFIGITAQPDAARAWGIHHEHLLRFDEGVGGRYSVWSTVGLGAATACGMPVFNALLEGAAGMDAHFFEQPLANNLPAWLGLMSVWNRAFMGYGSLAVVPYAERLALLPNWLQQLMMESNGKRARAPGIDAARAALPTAPVVWGTCGTTAQHSFFQQLHQGPEPVPVEFIVPRANEGRTLHNDERQRIMLANALAQASALALGRPDAAPQASGHQAFDGNRPSTLILLHDLSAHTLGALLAAYEHATFTAATVLGINPFDQYGVELGKQMAIQIDRILQRLEPTTDLHGDLGEDLDQATRDSLKRLL
ncbi:MAG: glucose-6-phosphate isomerase [Burkholderiales bacterium]